MATKIDIYLKDDENELIKKYQNGDIAAFNILYKKYSKLAQTMGRDFYFRYRIPSLTEDDYTTTCIESFYYAIKIFNADRDVSFFYYWKVTSNHEISRIIKETTRFYKNLAFSLDELINKQDGLTYGEIVTRTEEKDNEEFVSEKACAILNEEDSGILDEIEKEIVKLKAFGKSYRIIGEKYNLTIGQVRRIYNNALKKIRAHLDDNNFE